MNEVDDEFKARIEYIDVLSPHLGEVKALWRTNSATLGFFPDGAFADYARRRQILVALDPRDRCAGYVLYYSPLRPAFRDVTIMHLCVDKIYRRRGVATVLINHLKNRTKHCGGIRLRCCRDYEANVLWPKLGNAWGQVFILGLRRPLVCQLLVFVLKPARDEAPGIAQLGPHVIGIRLMRP